MSRDKEKLREILSESLGNYMDSGSGIEALEKFIEAVSIFKVGVDDVDVNWDDIRFPMVASNLDINSGKVDYNYFNGGADFQSNAKFPDNPVSMVCQMQHRWKLGSEIHPHIHWMQTKANVPNWLLAYKVMKNGEVVTDNSDFSNHIIVKATDIVFPYTSGTIVQISKFPPIDMSEIDSVSNFIHFVLFRDTTNASTLFDGIDPLSGKQLIYEFDVHYQIDAVGSRTEFIK